MRVGVEMRMMVRRMSEAEIFIPRIDFGLVLATRIGFEAIHIVLFGRYMYRIGLCIDHFICKHPLKCEV